MSESGKSRANNNRAIRRQELRDKLAAGGHIHHVLEMIDKLSDLKGTELETIEVQRLDKAIIHKKSLIDKYLPTEKPIEVTGEDGGPVAIAHVNRTIVNDTNS